MAKDAAGVESSAIEVELRHANSNTEAALQAVREVSNLLNGSGGNKAGLVTRMALLEQWRDECEKRDSKRFDIVKGLIIAVAAMFVERVLFYTQWNAPHAEAKTTQHEFRPHTQAP